MMRVLPRRLSLLALVFACTAVAAWAVPPSARIVQREGDDPRWSQRDWDDTDWTEGANIRARAGVRWVRFHVSLPSYDAMQCAPNDFRSTSMLGLDAPLSLPADGIYVASPCSYEMYWDGQLIGQSGKVGVNRADEVTGPLDNLFPLPDGLRTDGPHVIAVRVSTFHYNFAASEFSFGFGLVNYAQRLIWETRRPFFPMAGMSVALLVALISGVMFWFVDRRRPLLLCSALSLIMALFYLLIAVRWLYNLDYEWFQPRLLTITWLMTGIALLFPWLLLEQFGVPKKSRWLAALVPLLFLGWQMSEIYEIKSLWLCRAMLAFSLVAAGWAVTKKKPGALIILTGALAGLVFVRTTRREFLDLSFFLTFDVLVLYTFVSLGLQIRADRQRARDAVMSAARLEIELLKKNIQPHFLLNTLATIMEVIEQEPSTAVKLIEALAKEFRILARMSGEKLIPVAQEIELCRAHLQIMSLRKGVACSLRVDGVDGEAEIPPALFHTLVENGLTHLRPLAGEQRFELAAEYRSSIDRYVLTARGEKMPESERRKEGTGYRYIKARLDESYAGRWKMSSYPIDDGWETVIEIRGIHRQARIALKREKALAI